MSVRFSATDVLRRYMDGETIAAIALDLGCHRVTVRSRMPSTLPKRDTIKVRMLPRAVLKRRRRSIQITFQPARPLKDRMVELYEEGLTIPEIADQLQVREVSVRHHISMAGLAGMPMPYDEEIERLRLDGLSQVEIGKRLGLNGNSVGRRLRVIAGLQERAM